MTTNRTTDMIEGEVPFSFSTDVGIPPEVFRQDDATWPGDKATLLLLNRFVEACVKRPKHLILSGPSLSGKTYCLVRIFKYALYRKQVRSPDLVRYRTAGDLTDDWFKNRRDIYLRHELLLLDDVDATANAGTLEAVQRVIRERTTKGYPTVIATRLALDSAPGNLSFKEVYTEVEDRLTNMFTQWPLDRFPDHWLKQLSQDANDILPEG